MKAKRTSASPFSPMLAPWQPLATDASSVIGLRLMALPWQMMLVPASGRAEMNLMVSEKKAALAETQQALMMAPVRFWIELWSKMPLSGPQKAFSDAIDRTNQSIINPAGKRVRGNLKRLRA